MLPRAKNALRGFRRLAPGLSRAPFPWLALCNLVGCAMALGWKEFAYCLVLMFRTYLHPNE